MKSRLLIAFLIFFFRSFAQTADNYNDLAIQAFNNSNYALCIEYSTKALSVQSNGTSYWNRGASNFALKRYQEAKDDYTRAIPFYTDSESLGKLYRYRAECNLKLENVTSASSDLSIAGNYTIDNYGDYYWDMAALSFRQKNYKNAEEYYLKTLPYYDDIKEKSRLYRLISECRYYNGKNTEALESINYALDRDPGNVDAYKTKLNIDEAMERSKDAVEDCLKILDLDPAMNAKDKNFYYTKIARLKWDLGEYVSSIINGRKALQYDITNNITYWNLALAYSNNHETDVALELNEKAIALTTDDESLNTLYRNKAIFYSDLLQFRNALTAVNKALTYKNDPATVWRKAIIYAAMKNYPAALNEYENLVGLYSDSLNLSTIYSERAELWKEFNDVDRALYDMKKAMSLNNSTFMRYKYGRLLLDLGNDKERAKKILEETAAEEKRTDTSSNYSYAMVLLGDVDAGVENSIRLIDKYRFNKNQYPWALYNLACIYSLAGFQTKATDYLDKALAAGFHDYAHMLDDDDLKFIRPSAEYKLILAKYKVPLPQY